MYVYNIELYDGIYSSVPKEKKRWVKIFKESNEQKQANTRNYHGFLLREHRAWNDEACLDSGDYSSLCALKKRVYAC